MRAFVRGLRKKYGRYIQYMPWSDKIGFTQCIQIDTNGQNSYPILKHRKMPYNGTSNENAAFSLIFESLENPGCLMALNMYPFSSKVYQLEALAEKSSFPARDVTSLRKCLYIITFAVTYKASEVTPVLL